MTDLVLGVQILLGALGFAGGVYYTRKTILEVRHNDRMSVAYDLPTLYLKTLLGLGICLGCGITMINLLIY